MRFDCFDEGFVPRRVSPARRHPSPTAGRGISRRRHETPTLPVQRPRTNVDPGPYRRVHHRGDRVELYEPQRRSHSVAWFPSLRSHDLGLSGNRNRVLLVPIPVQPGVPVHHDPWDLVLLCRRRRRLRQDRCGR